jgi:hypothetical protein
MKSAILTAILLFSGFLFAQQEVALTLSYNADAAYLQELAQASTITLKYSGPKDFIEAMEANGTQNPSVRISGYKLKSEIRTGKTDANSVIPLTIKINVVEGEMNLPDDMVIHGHLKKGQMPVIDSIASNDMEGDMKKNMLETMQSMFSQLDFADQTVKVGGQFKRVTPISLPMPNGVKLDMDITTIYKLKDITDGIANFDVIQDFKMKTDVSEFTTRASGSGRGTMQYDTVNKFNKTYEMTLSMDGKVFVEKMKIETNTVMTMTQTMKLLPN